MENKYNALYGHFLGGNTMKKINVNKQYDYILNGFNVPHNAIYGDDTKGIGVYVCTSFTAPNPYLYRYNPTKKIWDRIKVDIKDKKNKYSSILRMAYSIADKKKLIIEHCTNPLNGLKSVIPKIKMPQTHNDGYMYKVSWQNAIDRRGHDL